MDIQSKEVINGWNLFTLKTDNVQIDILDYGATIVNLYTKNKYGEIGNVVLNYENLHDYLENPYYLGSLVGQVAGRIKDGLISIEGNEINLEKNEGNHHLHGGSYGLHNVKWESEIEKNEDFVCLKLKYIQTEERDKYPGNIEIVVNYILYSDSTFEMTYEAMSDKDTVLALTNHTYFNLNDDPSKNIFNHAVKMNSLKYLQLNNELIAEKVIDVAPGPFDFSSYKYLKEGIEAGNEQNKLVNGYDHMFLFDDKGKIEVEERSSGRKMIVSTDAPAVVMYTANDPISLNNIQAHYHLGVCFETQRVPASLWLDGLPTITLKKGERFKQSTKYEFMILD